MTRPTTTPTLPADLEAGLKRLKLAAIRHAAPEILLTAKTQRWKPEETLRVLVDLEVAARDESNCRNRMKAARFPVVKTLDEFNLDESSIPPASHDYLVTLDWIDRADNLCLVGPAGTGKTHYLIAIGRAAVEAGHRVRYYTAVELVEHLWRATADNTVGRAIEQLCRNQLLIIEIGFAPLDHTGCQLLFRLVAAAYEKRSLAIGSHSPFENWERFLPDQPTAVSLLDRLCHHAHIITTTGDSYRLTHRTTGGDTTTCTRGLLLATSEDRRWPPARTPRWPLTQAVACDFFTVDTALLRRYYVLFFTHIPTRQVFYPGVTESPTGAWSTQAARNLFLHHTHQLADSRALVRDRGSQFIDTFDEIFRTEGLKILKSPVRTPVANTFAERWIVVCR